MKPNELICGKERKKYWQIVDEQHKARSENWKLKPNYPICGEKESKK